jgi:hypothetical protein
MHNKVPKIIHFLHIYDRNYVNQKHIKKIDYSFFSPIQFCQALTILFF